MKQRIPTFFTSDWHIGHENCLKLDSRPFSNLNDMHRSLIKQYNSVVPTNGVCYFLGDIGLCKGDIIKKVIKQLNGKKILIRGNHDKDHNTMLNEVFDIVLYSASISIAKEIVTLTHCPLRGIKREDVEKMDGFIEGNNWHMEHKHARFSVPDCGQFHLHGHIHSPNGGKSKKILGRQYDVGVVANKYKPVSISQIESFICKTKQSENK